MFMTQNMLYFVNVLCASEKKNVFYCFWRREYYININQVKLVDGGVHVFYILLILCLIVLCYCKEKLKSFSYNIGLSISLFNFISVCSMFFKIQKVFVYVLNLQAFKIVSSFTPGNITLSKINIAILTLFCLVFTWYIFIFKFLSYLCLHIKVAFFQTA